MPPKKARNPPAFDKIHHGSAHNISRYHKTPPKKARNLPAFDKIHRGSVHRISRYRDKMPLGPAMDHSIKNSSSKSTGVERSRLRDVGDGFLPIPLACEQQRTPWPWISCSTSTRLCAVGVVEGCGRLGTGAAAWQVEETEIDGVGEGLGCRSGLALRLLIAGWGHWTEV
jgi:hypothetical protein